MRRIFLVLLLVGVFSLIFTANFCGKDEPPQPEDLLAEAVSPLQINLSWDAEDGEGGSFSIERKVEEGEYQEIVGEEFSQFSYEDIGLTCDTSYYYRIRGIAGGRKSEYANEVSATTQACWRAAGIDVGGDHSCAGTDTGGMVCWGLNIYGQLGFGRVSEFFDNYPGNVTGLAGEVVDFSLGQNHTCAVIDTGEVQCWGADPYGLLGVGNTTADGAKRIVSPNNVVGLGGSVASVSSGYDHTCALLDGGGVKCWGDNTYGQLGTKYGGQYPDDLLSSTVPVDVEGLAHNVTAISAGDFHTCALTSSGGVACWGDNAYGQLGNGIDDGPDNCEPVFPEMITRSCSYEPVDVIGISGNIASIAAGRLHTCALDSSGAASCWGRNLTGVLGNNSDVDSNAPVDVSVASGAIGSIFAGGFTCALLTNGDLECWGHSGPYDTPQPVSLPDGEIVEVSIGPEEDGCIMIDTGGIKCWNDLETLGLEDVPGFVQ